MEGFDVVGVFHSVHLRHVLHLDCQSRLPRPPAGPREHHGPQLAQLRRPQPPAHGADQFRQRRGQRVLERRKQRRRVVVAQIVRPDPLRVKQQAAVAREARIGSPRPARLFVSDFRRPRRHQVDDPRRRAPRRFADVEHDGQHRREPVAGAEPPAPPLLHVEAVHVVADTQRHQVVDGGLELQHHHQVQPWPGSFDPGGVAAPGRSDGVRPRAWRERIVRAAPAQMHPPHRVVAVAARRLGVVGDRLLVHAGQGGEVQRIDQRVHAVALGDEPAHQILDHERGGQEVLVGGVGFHADDVTRGGRGGQRTQGAPDVGARPECESDRVRSCRSEGGSLRQRPRGARRGWPVTAPGQCTMRRNSTPKEGTCWEARVRRTGRDSEETA